MRRAVTDRILKKGNASDGRKRYNSVFCVTKALCERKLCKKAMSTIIFFSGVLSILGVPYKLKKKVLSLLKAARRRLF